MEIWIQVTAAVGILFVVLALAYVVRRTRRRGKSLGGDSQTAKSPGAPVVGLPSEFPTAQKLGGDTELAKRLHRTRGNLLGGLGRFFTSGRSQLGAAEWEEIEEALLAGDVGVATSSLLIGRVKDRATQNPDAAIKDLFQQESEKVFEAVAPGLPLLGTDVKPLVISIVGVNGVGKTTTIGKLASYFSRSGKTVLLGAGDTFRAAAIAQLQIWADRTQSQFVAGREGGDPGAVAFDAVTAGKSRGLDVILLDSAGRLHTKTNLMEELKKVHRVIKKVIPEAPHETWLIVDGTLGQNSVQQAREFQKTLELTGIIVTKLDGTAKGGAVVSIAAELKLPIRFIGVGESAEDLIPFESKAFVQAILGNG